MQLKTSDLWEAGPGASEPIFSAVETSVPSLPTLHLTACRRLECRLFQQIVADAFQLPVRLPMEADAAAVGAALQAGAAMEGVPVADFVNACAPALQDEVLPLTPRRKMLSSEPLSP